MQYDADERAYLWLCACTTTDYRTRSALLDSAPSPKYLLEEPEKYFPAEERLYHADRRERELEVDALISHLEKKGCFAVTLISDDYPEQLKHISMPPLILYGMGRRELLQKRRFCIVGSRITPPWAEKMGYAIAEELSEHFAIVTGLAEGGDSAAIAGALESGNLICVLPCGITECYPAAHASLKKKIAQRGLILSELLPGERPKKYTFHARNRILAALSEGVLVISAAKRSGTLITANYALDFNRDVFALPHNAGVKQGEGCNDLLKKGAFVVTDTEDILNVYNIKHVDKKAVKLTAEEKAVLEMVRQSGDVHAAFISQNMGMSVFEAMAILSALEIKGVAVRSGGNRFSAV